MTNGTTDLRDPPAPIVLIRPVLSSRSTRRCLHVLGALSMIEIVTSNTSLFEIPANHELSARSSAAPLRKAETFTSPAIA
jgi:hypothetical protein